MLGRKAGHSLFTPCIFKHLSCRFSPSDVGRSRPRPGRKVQETKIKYVRELAFRWIFPLLFPFCFFHITPPPSLSLLFYLRIRGYYGGSSYPRPWAYTVAKPLAYLRIRKMRRHLRGMGIERANSSHVGEKTSK